VLHEIRGLFHHLEVRLFENNFLSGALSAGLLAGLLRPADYGALAEGIEAANKNLPEAAAVGDQ